MLAGLADEYLKPLVWIKKTGLQYYGNSKNFNGDVPIARKRAATKILEDLEQIE